jgi:fatty-acyl-CoA synthase
VRSGLVRPESPQRVARIARAYDRHGLLAAAVSIGAIRHGDRAALIDERGELTFQDLDRRSNALANGWRERGLQPGEGVAILVKNHRGLLDAVFAAAKCGARIVLLNTSFAGPQIREVAGREGTDLLVYDDEYGELLEGIDPPRGRWRAWTDDLGEPAPDTLEALIAAASPDAPPKAGVSPRVEILTS